MSDMPTKAQARTLEALASDDGAKRLEACVFAHRATWQALLRRGWAWFGGQITDEGRGALARYRGRERGSDE